MSAARFCMACGGRLASRRVDGRRRLRCLACGWIFYGNPIPAAVAIITRRGQVLLGRRARPPYAGTWDLPGGFLEAGETPEGGLRRELREELGLEIERARFVAFGIDRYGRRGFPVLAMVYHVVPARGRPRPADDISEARWFPRDALPFRRIAFASMRRALREFVARRPRRPRSVSE